jgi:hypothetical protein
MVNGKRKEVAKCGPAGALTVEDLHKLIDRDDYHQFVGTHTVACCLTLKNGFTVVGESTMYAPELFSYEIAFKRAFDSAVEKLWVLERYRLQRAKC